MKKLLISALLLGMVVSAGADVILGFDVQGCDSTFATWSAGTIAGNVEATAPLSRVGVNPTAAANSFNSTAWNVTDVFDEEDDYITFSLRAEDGYSLTLSSLEYYINGSSTGPRNGRWGYSVDGGSFTLQTPWDIASASGSAYGIWDFDDVVTAGTVEFRFWSYGTQGIGTGSAAAGGTVRVMNAAGNDLIVNGTTAVIPEPTSIALILIGLTGLRIFARRRHS